VDTEKSEKCFMMVKKNAQGLMIVCHVDLLLTKAAIQQPLLNNSFTNKLVPMATTELQQ
jgi:hypothetical protein